MAAAILARLLAGLAPGGVAIFQIPTHLDGYRFDNAEYLASAQPQMEINAIPQADIFAIVDAAGCRPLEVREDMAIADIPAVSQTFVVQRRR